MLEQKLRKLLTGLRKMGRVAICFSGGTDSSFLARAAGEALERDKLLLLHVSSELVPRQERGFVETWTAANGLPLKIITAAPLANEAVVRNDPQRCYFCKKAIMELVFAEAEKNGLKHVLDGINRDDLDDYRPGNRAADEYGVRHPLLEAGLDKAEIRILAQRWKLPNWDTPPSACLASRLPYGTKLTSERLVQVDRAEEFLRQLGYRGCRVRCRDDAAKIELQPADFVSAAENARLIVEKLREIGFREVLLDLRGYVRGGGFHPN
ncbi:MAG: ATP-dependent sacrificial sulfur transferase LarE [Victivallaceae bacterium]|nr:ATP-dependent sacrificial sulfur transferase LarE [Victivallaceae bacterium]